MLPSHNAAVAKIKIPVFIVPPIHVFESISAFLLLLRFRATLSATGRLGRGSSYCPGPATGKRQMLTLMMALGIQTAQLFPLHALTWQRMVEGSTVRRQYTFS
jgi:hypothetical protein